MFRQDHDHVSLHLPQVELNKDYGLHSKIIVNLQDEIYWTGLAFVQCFRLQVTLYSCPQPIWNHQLTQVALRDANSRLKGSSWVSNSKPPFCVVTVLPTVLLWHQCSGSWHIKCLKKIRTGGFFFSEHGGEYYTEASVINCFCPSNDDQVGETLVLLLAVLQDAVVNKYQI